MNKNINSNLIDELRNELKALPKKKLQLEYVITQLEPEITNAIKNKNYTHEEICQILLEKKSISIKPSTLKTYLNKAKIKPEATSTEKV